MLKLSKNAQIILQMLFYITTDIMNSVQKQNAGIFHKILSQSAGIIHKILCQNAEII
jgi:hypothetical protein